MTTVSIRSGPLWTWCGRRRAVRRVAVTVGLSLLTACEPLDAGNAQAVSPAEPEISASGKVPFAPLLFENVAVSETEASSLAATIVRQVAEHWLNPAEAAHAGLRVKIDVSLLPDARVLSADVIAVIGDGDDDAKQALVEVAQNALLHFRTHPFQGLPPDDYDYWRHFILELDARLPVDGASP